MSDSLILEVADIETDVATDPLVTDVGWSWLTDALAAGNADQTVVNPTGSPISSIPTSGPRAVICMVAASRI